MKIANSKFLFSKENALNWYSKKLNTPPAYFEWWLKDIDAANYALGKLGWIVDGGYPVDKWMQIKDGYDILLCEAFEPIFDEEEFQLIKQLMLNCNEDKLFVVELAVPEFITEKTAPSVAFEFSSSLTYQQIVQGGALTERFFNWCNGDYFVFGSSGQWAKFVINDSDNPIQAFVFKKDLVTFFNRK